uniref:Peptidase S1 domain-containing protein n=1 Tax=Glossina brevipalpis TaxID=37001 RepID=A0A1A9WMU5_9MUSC
MCNRGNITSGGKIVGGYRPRVHSLAKYAALFAKRSDSIYLGINYFCTGAIIGEDVILTAAHCVDQFLPYTNQKGRLLIIVGTAHRLHIARQAQYEMIERIKVHESFDRRNPTHDDIALVWLANPITIDGVFRDIAPLADYPSPSLVCTVIGWGRLYPNGPIPDEILYAELNITNRDNCKIFGGVVNENNYCTLSHDHENPQTPCMGDSGAPLFCGDEIHGVLSYGDRDCNYFSIYTGIYKYLHWIQELKSAKMNGDIIKAQRSFLILLFFYVILRY